MSRTTRLFKLMDALRGHRRPVTAARLADDLSVSVRTLYRDIQTLIDLGATPPWRRPRPARWQK
jgi:predicted DNA-binding transcriptional regulator YafY